MKDYNEIFRKDVTYDDIKSHKKVTSPFLKLYFSYSNNLIKLLRFHSNRNNYVYKELYNLENRHLLEEQISFLSKNIKRKNSN